MSEAGLLSLRHNAVLLFHQDDFCAVPSLLQGTSSISGVVTISHGGTGGVGGPRKSWL